MGWLAGCLGLWLWVGLWFSLYWFIYLGLLCACDLVVSVGLV